MMAVARSSLVTSLRRYARSWGLWVLLLVGPVGARFWVPRADGTAITIAVDGKLPVMTSAMIGVSLGVVVSTMLLPVAFVYLRSNTTRRQPWQIEEVTAASRVGIALGRFAADGAILWALLAALTVAGWILAALTLPWAQWHPVDVAFALWAVAAPAMALLAALRMLFDAVLMLRRGWGECAYFLFWMFTLTAPILVAGSAQGFWANLVDSAGYMRPLLHSAGEGADGLVIGAAAGINTRERIALDVIAGIASPGYLASRLAWIALATGIAALSGLVYRPHRAKTRRARFGWVMRWLAPGAPPAADSNAPPAPASRVAWLDLVAAEFRLIGAGRPFKLLALAAAALGVVGDFRHVGSPAGALLLAFALTAHAGRAEARGLLALTSVALLSPGMRRAAFVVAGTAWMALLALPAAVVQTSFAPVALGLTVGGFGATVAIMLAATSRSAFAPRMLLLILWYGYMSS
jgi:hypothetical protein